MTIIQERTRTTSLLGVLLLSSLLSCFVFAEVALRVIVDHARLTTFGRTFTNTPGLLLILPAAFVAFLALRYGAKGLGLLALVSVIAITVIFRFRGAYTWPGTFDAYWLSLSLWAWHMAGGALVGGIVGALRPAKAPPSQKSVYVSIGILAGLTALNFTFERLKPLDSIAAETQSIALTGIIFLLIISLALENRKP